MKTGTNVGLLNGAVSDIPASQPRALYGLSQSLQVDSLIKTLKYATHFS